MDIDTIKMGLPIGSLVCCVLAHLCHRHKVSYCDHRMSVIRQSACLMSVTYFFKQNLLLNKLAEFYQTLLE